MKDAQDTFNFDEVTQAYGRIKNYIRETPLEQSFYLGENGRNYFFKLESFQRAKSFKIRGALNKMLSLSEKEKAQGVATISSGNHGSSVSYAASLLGVEKAVIIVPETTPQSKIDKIRYFGADVMKLGKNYDEAHALGMDYIRDKALIYIDACYDDPKIYGGQGTIAIEILKQIPDIDTIVVPVGGGGMITGIAVAAKSIKPEIRIIGVQTEACPAMVRAFTDKVFYEEYPITGDTVCDALVGGIGKLAYEMLPKYIDDLFEVPEVAIRSAVKYMALKEKYVVEGGSATTVAAVRECRDRIGGKNIALIISGGNIDGALMQKLLTE